MRIISYVLDTGSEPDWANRKPDGSFNKLMNGKLLFSFFKFLILTIM